MHGDIENTSINTSDDAYILCDIFFSDPVDSFNVQRNSRASRRKVSADTRQACTVLLLHMQVFCGFTMQESHCKPDKYHKRDNGRLDF